MLYCLCNSVYDNVDTFVTGHKLSPRWLPRNRSGISVVRQGPSLTVVLLLYQILVGSSVGTSHDEYIAEYYCVWFGETARPKEWRRMSE